jgi:hypothetical protein
MKALLFITLLCAPGCSGMKLEGDCIATRKIELTLRCEGAGKIETFRTLGVPTPE